MKTCFATLAVIGALGIAASAHAQTQCFPNNPAVPMAGTTCYDNRPPDLPQPTEGARAGRGLTSCDLLGVYGESCSHQRARLRAHEDSAKAVGALVASGQCRAARDRALKDGDFELAGKAVAMCPVPASAP